jgi:hypothetical protein
MQCSYAVLSSVVCPAVTYFPPYFINDAIFGKSFWTQNLCFDFLSTFAETFLIHRRLQRDIFVNLCSSTLTYPLFLSDFNETLRLWTDFRKILKYKISWKFVRWETRCSMRADGWTDEQIWWSYRALFAVLRTRSRILHSTRREFLRVLCDSQNQLQLSAYKALTDLFL